MSHILQNRIAQVQKWEEIDEEIEVGEFDFEHLDDK